MTVSQLLGVLATHCSKAVFPSVPFAQASQYISYFSIQHLTESVLLSVTLPECLVLSSAAAA